MKIWRNANGTYSGVIRIGTALKATANDCASFEDCTAQLIYQF